MTGKDLIVYILKHNLENEVMFSNGYLLGFLTAEELAAKLNVGSETIKIWYKERPDIIVTTGTLVAYPFYLLSVLFRKRFVFIETFGRANMPTVAGRLMEKHSDLFIVQWETQKKHYKKAIYGGCLY